MGGCGGHIPIKIDPWAAKRSSAPPVLADKERDPGHGHDGTWDRAALLGPCARQASNHTCRRRIKLPKTSATTERVREGCV